MMDGNHHAGAQMPGHQGSFMGVHVSCNSVDTEQSNVRVARLETAQTNVVLRVAAMVDRQPVDVEENPHCVGNLPTGNICFVSRRRCLNGYVRNLYRLAPLQ